MMTKKILFLHGFFASGSCTPAQALRQAFAGKTEVLTPDLPLHPNEALEFIEDICKQEKPCALVGNSNGAFLAQIVASRLGLPALLGNPYLEMMENPQRVAPVCQTPLTLRKKSAYAPMNPGRRGHFYFGVFVFPGFDFPHTFTGQFDWVCRVYNPVKYRIRHGRIPDGVIPVGYRDL